MNLKFHIKIALGYFLIVAFLGVMMRMFQVVDIDFNYKNILHTHSHIALLGWVYTALTTLIYNLFLTDKNIEKSYKNLFWSTQLSIIGMMLTFPFTGYALLSIVFSTYFLINSYLFLRLFLKHTTKDQKEKYSYKLIRASLWLMVLSSLGPWALGGIMNTLGSTSSWYRNAIYFYLHFQYNGWFLLALFGMCFYVVEKLNFNINKKHFINFYRTFISGVFLTFFLSVLWMKPNPIFYFLAAIGGILQLYSLINIRNIIIENLNIINQKCSKFEILLVKIVSLLFGVKLLFQLLGALPVISNFMTISIDLVIAYLHWIFLGVVTISILVLLKYFKMMVFSKPLFWLYFSAFIITEGLLFYKAIVVWNKLKIANHYYEWLFLASCLFLVSLIGLFISQFRKNS